MSHGTLTLSRETGRDTHRDCSLAKRENTYWTVVPQEKLVGVGGGGLGSVAVRLALRRVFHGDVSHQRRSIFVWRTVW